MLAALPSTLTRWATSLALVAVVGCSPANDAVFTLYRNSPIDASMRIHVASFDTRDSAPNYNQENCTTVADVMQSQPRVTARYWCEKGRYRE